MEKQRGMKLLEPHPPRLSQRSRSPPTRCHPEVRSIATHAINDIPLDIERAATATNRKRFLVLSGRRSGSATRSTAGRLGFRFLAASDAQTHQQREQSKLLHLYYLSPIRPYGLVFFQNSSPDRSILQAEAVIHDPGSPGFIPTGIQIFYDTERIY